MTLRLTANAEGESHGNPIERHRLWQLQELHEHVVSIVRTDSGPRMAGDVEIEIDCDYGLQYKHVIAAITAVLGHRSEADGTVIKLIEKLRFAPPRKPASETGQERLSLQPLHRLQHFQVGGDRVQFIEEQALYLQVVLHWRASSRISSACFRSTRRASCLMEGTKAGLMLKLRRPIPSRRKTARGWPAISPQSVTGFFGANAGPNDAGEGPDHRGAEGLAEMAHLRVVPIGRHQVLHEVIGTDRYEVDGRQHGRDRNRGRRHLQHHPQLDAYKRFVFGVKLFAGAADQSFTRRISSKVVIIGNIIRT